MLQETRIAPMQTRIVPIKVAQTKPISVPHLEFTLMLRSGDRLAEIRVALPVQSHAQWTAGEVPPAGIKASYFFGTSMPTAFLVTPPKEPHGGAAPPPVLALRTSLNPSIHLLVFICLT